MPGWSVDAVGRTCQGKSAAVSRCGISNPPLTRLERGYWATLRDARNHFKTVSISLLSNKLTFRHSIS